MDSRETKMGGGSGGGPSKTQVDSHDDVRFVNGSFSRTADSVKFLAYPRGDNSPDPSVVLGAAGDNALINLASGGLVLIEARQPGDPTGKVLKETAEEYEIIVSATMGHGILIQRGNPADTASFSCIQMDSHGNIFINAGALKGLSLTVGLTTNITMTDEDITIAAETVNIQGHKAVNINCEED